MSLALISTLLNKTLSHNQNFQDLKSQLTQIENLSDLFACSLPVLLKDKFQIGTLTNETLIVFTHNNSTATRIRHLSPAIITTLKKNGYLVEKIKINIRQPEVILTKNTKRNKLTKTAIKHIQELIQNQDESTLKIALKNLLAHQNKNHS